ncbi:MAG: OadG family protein [Pseudomonadota bacterium]
MELDIVTRGLELMLYGMGTVVLFLAVLVVAMMAMSAIIGNYFPELHRPEAVAKPSQVTPDSVSHVDPITLAVITAAIHEHRKRGR